MEAVFGFYADVVARKWIFIIMQPLLFIHKWLGIIKYKNGTQISFRILCVASFLTCEGYGEKVWQTIPCPCVLSPPPSFFSERGWGVGWGGEGTSWTNTAQTTWTMLINNGTYAYQTKKCVGKEKKKIQDNSNNSSSDSWRRRRWQLQQKYWVPGVRLTWSVYHALDGPSHPLAWITDKPPGHSGGGGDK